VASTKILNYLFAFVMPAKDPPIGARNVFVRLSTINGSCCLSIDDDGCGFPFTGRLSQADLEASRKGPVVIKERVRQIGGALTVEVAV